MHDNQPDAQLPRQIGPAGILRFAAIAVWCIVIAVIAIRLGFRPAKNSVYPLFHATGCHWLAGENLYAHVGDFRYSPLVAALFGLLSLFPLVVGQYCWLALNLLGLGAGILAWIKYALPANPSPTLRWTLVLLATPIMIGSVNNLQANPLMLGLMLLAVTMSLRKRWTFASIAIIAATMLKLYPIALGLVLILQFPRQLAWRILLFLAIATLLPFAMQKPSYVAESYRQWVTVLSQDNRVEHGSGVQVASSTDSAPTTAISPPKPLMYRDAAMFWHQWIGPVDGTIYRLTQGMAALLVGVVALWARFWKIDMASRLAFLFALVICWILLLGPSTESATYILAGPVAGWMLMEAMRLKRITTPLFPALFGYAMLLIAVTGSWIPGERAKSWALQPAGVILLLASLILWQVGGKHEKNNGVV